ncbi:hypothetical protein AC1031_022116 [Aphanomyces cochlioides]|nr:hypothetical protein AC1031_022116 [Aphanomyces cochlioides]
MDMEEPQYEPICYRLEHFKSKREWVPDAERSHCVVCRKRFLLGGKHHCRRCGEVVCKQCGPLAQAELPVVGRTQVRVCVVCHDNPTAVKSISEESFVKSIDDENPRGSK